MLEEDKGSEGEELMQAQYMMVCLRDDRSIQITIHTRSRIQSPQLLPRVLSMVLFQGRMAHTWWSALCKPSRVGNKFFTLPLEKGHERKEGLLALST